MIKRALLAIFIILTPIVVHGQNVAPPFCVEEEDGTPSSCFPVPIKFPNGSVTANADGSVSIVEKFNNLSDPSSDTSIDFTSFTNAWTSTGSSGEFFSIGNATNGGIFSVDRSGKVGLGDPNDDSFTALRAPGTITVCPSNTSFAKDSCDYILDGVNDQVELKQASDEIIDSGNTYGEIYIPNGRVTFGAPWVIKGSTSPYIRLGVTCSLGAGTEMTASNSFSGNNLIEFTESTNSIAAALMIENCFMSGNRDNVTIGAIDTKVGGANNTPIWDLHLIRTIMFSFGANAVVVDNPWGFVCLNCQVEDSDECGIVISQGGTGTGNAKTNGAQILGGKIVQVGQGTSPSCLDAIKITGVGKTRIIGNELGTEATGGYAVNLVNADATMIMGNDFGSGDTAINGLSIDGNTTYSTVVGNVFSDLSGVGILLNSSATKNSIVANSFSGITGDEVSGVLTGNHYCQNWGDDSATSACVVGFSQCPFSLDSDTDAALCFGATGYEFRDTNANVSALFNLSGTLYLLPQASAPGTCSIGEIYIDTSGAACSCTASDTWSNMTSTGSCS